MDLIFKPQTITTTKCITEGRTLKEVDHTEPDSADGKARLGEGEGEESRAGAGLFASSAFICFRSESTQARPSVGAPV